MRLILLVIAVLFYSCKNKLEPVQEYLNLSDTAYYVGKETCMQCHYNIYETYNETGMGQSIAKSSKEKSALILNENTILNDTFLDLSYMPKWKGDTLFLKEFSKHHSREEIVDYIIGSGHHTNSHLWSENGYVHQMPFTFYTQESKIDLPPGYENGFNSRFSRKISLECMSCHNAFPDIVLGSENKYHKIPEGIDCERCHGPGSIHVSLKQSGEIIDTSKYIDYSIVNPSKLDLDKQFDVCMRCHLQGNTVLEEDKSFYDYKPGMNLSDVLTVFLPKYENDESFIMASHVDRLKQSKCFQESEMTCITCHDPHHSVQKLSKNFFNDKCMNCHDVCEEKPRVNNNCIECHMPKSHSIDIPHVSISDHKIGIHKYSDENIKGKFLGLFPINNDNPSIKTIAIAYIQQYEKFSKQEYMLDSAFNYLNKLEIKNAYHEWVHLYFIKKDYNSIRNIVYSAENRIKLNKTSYDNKHAWTAYRIGESFYKINQFDQSNLYYQKSVDLAPYVLDFRLKLGVSLLKSNKLDDAIKNFEWIINEFPKMEEAFNNLGFIYLQKKNFIKAEYYLKKSLSLNPLHIETLFNLSALFKMIEDDDKMIHYLERILEIQPKNNKALKILKSINYE